MNWLDSIKVMHREKRPHKNRLCGSGSPMSACETCARYKGRKSEWVVTDCSEYTPQKIRKYRIRHEDGTEEVITEYIPVEECPFRGENNGWLW